MLLCDGAQVVHGKLYVLGWGWTHIGPDPWQQALAIKLDLDEDDLGKPHHMEVFLEGEDGEVVMIEQADGTMQALEVPHDFELPRLPELGDGVSVCVPINFAPLPLAAGRRYTWRLVIDGESEESWRVSFSTRSAEPAEVV
jgi:hypothetical protein